MLPVKEKIQKLLESLNVGLHERSEVIAVALLGALANQNTFLFGPPGTAKSLIARRLACSFEDSTYFEYLMQRFSTPEEVFGPVSISELKKDNFVRKTQGFLPEAEFAFLDEIWKSGPAILNTLLTIINEKLFRNGTQVERVPLKALIAASNETPPPGQGLEALYDRFIVRLNVPPMKERDNFETLLTSMPTSAAIEVPRELLIGHDEWNSWRAKIHDVRLSKETLSVIHAIRLKLAEKSEALGVYVSDRRWQRAAVLLKASAFFCGRRETNIVDALLLRHCLWTSEQNRNEVIQVVEASVLEHGFSMEVPVSAIDQEKDALETEIKVELFHTEDVYQTFTKGESEYYRTQVSDGHYHSAATTIYIPVSKRRSNEDFHPVDGNGNEIDFIKCNFSGQDLCRIHRKYNGRWIELVTFVPTVAFHKGDKKQNVNTRLLRDLKKSISSLSEKIQGNINHVDEKMRKFQRQSCSPFVPGHVQRIATDGVELQLQDLRLRYKDCERLNSLVGIE